MDPLFVTTIPALYSKLDLRTLATLMTNPKIEATIQEVEKIPEYWKERTEYLVGLTLDFDPPRGTETQYWKQMYEELLQIMQKSQEVYLRRLLNSGRREFLLILIRLDPEYYKYKDFAKAFTNSIRRNDVEAVKMLFDIYSGNRIITWNNTFRGSITAGNDVMFYTLLDLLEPYMTKHGVELIIGHVSISSRIDYFKKVVEKYGSYITLQDAAYIAYDVIEEIVPEENDLVEPEKHAQFLEYILSIPTENDYYVSKYWNAYISEEEALVLVSSDKVIIDDIPFCVWGSSSYILRVK